MVHADVRLKLAYAFVPMPTPIRASAPGANPNRVDLQVIVSNPSMNDVAMARIEIEVPVGEESSRTLSTSISLPAPRYDTKGPWSIMTDGDTISILPAVAGG